MATIKSSIPGLERARLSEPPTVKNRLNWSIYGETKSGKTTFALEGAESPIGYCDLDKRCEGVEAFETVKNRGILAYYPVEFPKVDPMSRKADESVRRLANTEWDKWLETYDLLLKSSQLKGGVKRIVPDTATELFDLRLMAEFGRLMGINPRDRGGANAEFIEVMRRFEHYDANVIWLHHAKEEWKNSVDDQGREKSMTTGNYILDGFKKANSVVQVVAKTVYNDKERDPRKRFEVHVIRCGVNSKLNNTKFTSMDWAVYEDERDKESPPIINYGPLAYISSLIRPDSSPEDWQ